MGSASNPAAAITDIVLFITNLLDELIRGFKSGLPEHSKQPPEVKNPMPRAVDCATIDWPCRNSCLIVNVSEKNISRRGIALIHRARKPGAEKSCGSEVDRQ